MNREHELNVVVDFDAGFSAKELKDIGSRTMNQKLKDWLSKREPAQWTFQRQNEADIRQCQARRKG